MVLAIIALIGYTIVGDIISGAQESADKENVREYARSVRLAITSAQMNGQTTSSSLSSDWLTDNVEKTGNEVKCSSVTDNNGTITLSGCSVGGSVKKYCYDGTDVTTCTRLDNNIVKIYGTEDATFYDDKKTANLFNQAIIETEVFESFSDSSTRSPFKEGVWYVGLTANNYSNPNHLKVNSGDTSYTVSFNKLMTKVLTKQNPYGLTQSLVIEPNQTYSFGASISSVFKYDLGISCYTESGNIIKDKWKWHNNGSVTDNTLYETPSDCYWMTVSLAGQSGVETTYSNVQLVKGDKLPNDYEPYGYKITIKATPEEGDEKTIIVYIGGEKLGANDYLSYDGSNWNVVRNGTSTEAIMVKGTVPTGKVTYSVE